MVGVAHPDMTCTERTLQGKARTPPKLISIAQPRLRQEAGFFLGGDADNLVPCDLRNELE